MERGQPDIYGGVDPRDVPAYSVSEAAAYLRLPPSTLRSWLSGNEYPTREGLRRSAPLVIRNEGSSMLSFMNLVEAHVLASIRRRYGVKSAQVRRAVEYVRDQLGTARPLLRQQFQTDGVALFIDAFGKLMEVSAEGQIAIKEALEAGLKRVERDPEGLPLRLFPWARTGGVDQPRLIEVDPRKRFGRPVLAGTGISVDILFDRFEAGDSLAEIARDHRVPPELVEEAVRFGKGNVQAAA